MMTEERLLKPTDPVYDLVDVVEGNPSAAKEKQEIIMIDGRVYGRMPKPEDRIFDLEEVAEEGKMATTPAMSQDIRIIAAEMAERIAREVVPGIAERIIREEIEKLKSQDNHSSSR